MISKKSIYLFLILVPLFFGGGVLKHYQNKTQPSVVELRDDGFHPSKLTIKQGQSVTFVTKVGKPFWPASNVHPTHELYPAFDPKRPLDPSETWTFKFDNVGEWPYHDHLIPGYTGVIKVEGSVTDRVVNCKYSDSLSKPQHEECWEKTINLALKKNGVKAAIHEMKNFYVTDPLFIMDGCHLHAHRLGEAAYGMYLVNKNLDDLDLDADSVACGYGFYHGFLEHLFRSNPDITEGRRLCTYLIDRLSSQVPGIRLNCYHALGHGFMEDPPKKQAWGNPQAMVDPALQNCEKLPQDGARDLIIECLQGAFNVLGDWIAEDKYGIKSPEDKMWLCPQQKMDDWKNACYYELSMRIHDLHSIGIVKIYEQYVKKIKDDKSAEIIINNVAASMVERAMTKNDFSEYLQACQQLPEQFVTVCVRGTVGGIMAQAEPGVEYVKTEQVCNGSGLSENLKQSCYEHLAERMRRFYSREKIAQICPQFPKMYQKFCFSN